MNDPYGHEFSHEFEDGPSGPARSYWIPTGPGMASYGPPVCLHHRDHMNASIQMEAITHMLNTAYRAGRQAMADDLKTLMEYPNGRRA